MTKLLDIWHQLATGPLLWLAITLAAYAIGDWLSLRSGRAPLVNPVLIAASILALVLYVTQTPYETYFAGAQFVHILLGPATVALALPLWDNRARMRRAAIPIAAALLVGSATAIMSALTLASAFGVEGRVLISLAPKSATAPVAIGIAENMGGLPTLTAVLAILTGIVGAIIATPLLNLLGADDVRARGFALGLTSHGIGTARALNLHPTAGAFAGLGMGLNAMLTALIAPYALWLFK